MAGHTEKKAKRARSIRRGGNQRLLAIFAPDDVTAVQRELLSATRAPGEVGGSDVNCGCNEERLKEGQAWSFIAVNNGCV